MRTPTSFSLMSFYNVIFHNIYKRIDRGTLFCDSFMSLQHIEVKTRAVHFRLLAILHLRGYVRTSRQRSTIIVVRKLVIHRSHFSKYYCSLLANSTIFCLGNWNFLYVSTSFNVWNRSNRSDMTQFIRIRRLLKKQTNWQPCCLSMLNALCRSYCWGEVCLKWQED